MSTHWGCLENCLFVSIMSLVLIVGVLSIVNCFHYAMDTNKGCLDNCLFVSIMSWVLIRDVLSIVYLTPLCRGYSL